MKKWLRLFFAILIICYTVFATAAQPLEPYGPTPTENQIRWHETEYYGLVCFGLNTYTEQEWGYGDIPPEKFNPSDLDTDQWASISKAAGLKGLILVAKHHDGFCLWPSKTTNYTVAATPWKNGNGDVLGDLAKSCKKFGLKLGVYISPWDRNHHEYAREQYVKDFHQQWREVLTNYGQMFEVWFDGANGGTGYYGGARERRSITKDYYQFEKLFILIKEKQPDTIFFGGNFPIDSVRWVGNESGYAGTTNWCTFIKHDSAASGAKREVGVKNGQQWLPAEADTTLLWPKAWYFHSNSKPRTLKQLVDVYYQTIGRNATFNLGLAIAPSGKIRQIDADAMIALKKQLDKDFANNLAQDATIAASNTRATEFTAQKTLDQSTNTYWATEDGVNKASLTIELGKEQFFNRLLLQEYIRLGQRIHSFTLEAQQKNTWQNIASGTTIGYKRILRLPTTKAQHLRLTFQTDAPCLTLSNLEIYNAPIILSDPIITTDKNSLVTINAPQGAKIFYSIKDQSFDPSSVNIKVVATDNPDGSTTISYLDDDQFSPYSEPFKLEKGGIVQAYATDPATGERSGTTRREIGPSKAKWTITGCSYPNQGGASVQRLIDGNNKTMWHTHGPEGRKQPPQWVTIDLGETLDITAFTYMPRHDGDVTGLVDKYSFYTSSDGINWNEPVSQGEFSNIKNNPIQQTVPLPQTTPTRYIKFVAEHAVNQNSCVAICELGLLVKYTD